MLFDLNCDLGEGAGNDQLIMPFITSANIACGGHAGSLETMQATINLALEHSVKIGAHPGYPDPQNFGRKSVIMSHKDLLDSIVSQIRALKEITEQAGGILVHVKPHGALYTDAARDSSIAQIIAEAVFQVDPKLVLFGLSGSEMIRIAEMRGLKVAHEGFADRSYTDNGQLVPRSMPGAMITDLSQSLKQVERMVSRAEVVTLNGKILPIRADTVCIHGDQPGAPLLAKKLKLSTFQELSTLQELTTLIFPLGDTAFLIRLGEEISPEINIRVQALADLLRLTEIPGLAEVIPAYADVMVIYNPNTINWTVLLARIKELVAGIEDRIPSEIYQDSGIVEIPVWYGGEDGPDLQEVAQFAGIPEDEVIRKHIEGEYRVYMMGFTPGFCYLGGLDPAIHAPRKTEPRLKISAGSVGIAGSQTGIYPIESPGGWQIIGRTPLRLFDPEREEPFLFRAGMAVKFRQMTNDERRMEEDGRRETGGFNSQDRALSHDLSSVIGYPSFVRVLEPGFLTTIQDAGRPGYRAYGMPVGGALDSQSMYLANQLIDNDESEAVLEITFIGPVLEFLSDTVIAITGADMQPMILGAEKCNGQRITIKAGDQLSFSGLRSGLRSYLAIAGGFHVPTVMGSRSTYLRGKIGGYKGRALMAGDIVAIGHRGTGAQGHKGTEGHKGTGAQGHEGLGGCAQLRFIPGPETCRFTLNGLRTFLESEFTMSPNSDRMGIRLEGPSVEHRNGADIISSGVIPGTIQVPGDGRPIILLNDCQCTGGYTRIGCVIREDLPLLAQLKPGDKIRFAEERLAQSGDEFVDIPEKS